MAKSPPGATRAKIHEFVCTQILCGSPPSVREIQEAFRFKSTATAREHLDALVECGLLAQDPGRDRGYKIPGAFVPGLVPILGRVQAGGLSEAIESAEGYVPIESTIASNCFALVIRGESMAGREIHDGDIVLVERTSAVKSGDVVVAMIGDEATVKTYKRRGKRIVLQAENADYHDIIPDPNGEEFRILGRVFEIRKSL